MQSIKNSDNAHEVFSAVSQSIDYKMLDPRLADYPMQPSTAGSAAIDLRACIDTKQRVYPNGDMVFGTGIAIHIKDPGLVGLVVPRSGLGIKHGIVLRNLIGVIDSDYQGEIKVCLCNNGAYAHDVHPMDRIAQLLIVPVVVPRYNLVEEFSEATERGGNGFGSTGLK